MRTRRLKFLVLSLVGLGVILFTFAVTGPPAPVSVTIRRFDIFQTNNPGYYLHGPPIGSQYVAAHVDIHNQGSRAVTYWLAQSSLFVDYHLRYPSVTGWEDHRVSRLRSCQKQYTLPPGQHAEFWAVIDSDRPCRVALKYSRVLGPLWQRLPQWLTKRWPFDTSSIAETETIDWRRLPDGRQGE